MLVWNAGAFKPGRLSADPSGPLPRPAGYCLRFWNEDRLDKVPDRIGTFVGAINTIRRPRGVVKEYGCMSFTLLQARKAARQNDAATFDHDSRKWDSLDVTHRELASGTATFGGLVPFAYPFLCYGWIRGVLTAQHEELRRL